LFNLRSFLGLANYYICFIKGFATIARPLTNILKGDNGKVGANQSGKIEINLNQAQKEAFERLKNIVESEKVTLMYPDFSKPFDQTTEASQHGIGAVLSQGKRPITIISPAIRNDKEHLGANVKELLAIVWAVKSLRNYL